jgi:hypothetical protein
LRDPFSFTILLLHSALYSDEKEPDDADLRLFPYLDILPFHLILFLRAANSNKEQNGVNITVDRDIVDRWKNSGRPILIGGAGLI